MALLDEVKAALKITSTAAEIVIEVQNLIDAAKADLVSVGIDATVDTDPDIKQAVILYTKGHYGYNNPEAPRFLENYQMLKTRMCMDQDHVIQ